MSICLSSYLMTSELFSVCLYFMFFPTLRHVQSLPLPCVCDPPAPACPSPVPVAPTLCAPWLCRALTPAVLVPLGVVSMTVPPSSSKTFTPPCYCCILFLIIHFLQSLQHFQSFPKIIDRYMANIFRSQHILNLF